MTLWTTPDHTKALPSPHHLPDRQSQINYLAPAPSEMAGSLLGTDIYPEPAFLLGIAVTLIAVCLVLLVLVPLIVPLLMGGQ